MPFDDSFKPVFRAIVTALKDPRVNFSCTRADDVFGGRHIIEDILKGIGRAEVIIADVSAKNPNVFYELGIAHMVKDMNNVIILTQSMEDVPFDLRHLRCLIYTQSPGGLKKLRGEIKREIGKLVKSTSRFRVMEHQLFRFPEMVFGIGDDRCAYDFEIEHLFIISNGAKFGLRVYQHAIGQDTKTVYSETHGMKASEGMMLPYTPLRLVLERVSPGLAEFCLLPTDE
jgi:hypothetical protein